MNDDELLRRKYAFACRMLDEKVFSCPEGRNCMDGTTKEKDCARCWDIFIDISVKRGDDGCQKV